MKRIAVAILAVLAIFLILGCSEEIQPVPEAKIDVQLPSGIEIELPDDLEISNVVTVEVIGGIDVRVTLNYLSTYRSKPGFFYWWASGTISNMTDDTVKVGELTWKLETKDVGIQAQRMPIKVESGHTLPFLIITEDITDSMRYKPYIFQIEVE